MKDFIRPRGRLRSLPLAARVVYSVFLGFTLVALALSAWLAREMVGTDLAGVSAYYAGSDGSTSAVPEPAPGGDAGPVLELPPEADAPVGQPPMSTRKLLEVTHFHLFSMPVYLLILSHLFMLSRLSERAKVLWIALGTLAVGGHIAAPWVARAGGASAAASYAVSGALLAISMLVMGVVPLLEMWIDGKIDTRA
jgi:hypothetical protein